MTSYETPQGLSLINDPHLKITVVSKTSFLSQLLLVSQDLMAKLKKQNSTIIAVLSKLSVDDPEKWYSHVPHLVEQSTLTSPPARNVRLKDTREMTQTDVRDSELVT
ncbi:hypothetical protein TNCV_1502111 [Trichonephila clavipes]|uniref:Uncharacterized protein n=1 Tax=Trichonephila clavipes TaxID=2585209 RepID=A0A8X6RPK3_TRICX|nr:hypothetical protein TNCV_1502111 [Trichonephila clavipes]